MIDLDAMSVIGTVPVGRDPVEIDGPRQLLLVLRRASPTSAFLSADRKSPHVTKEGGGGPRLGYVQALSLVI